MKNIHLFLIAGILLFSCKSKQVTGIDTQYAATPKVVIYKTIRDFSGYVPVTMNASKTEIVSYPAPSDLIVGGKIVAPTVLKNGYLLDNRGITENVVFLKYTCEAYSKMQEAPSLTEMKNNILEKYPLAEFIYCGNINSGNPTIKALNKLIDNGFEGCKKAEITPLKVEF